MTTRRADFDVDGIPLRLYRPAAPQENLPTLVFMHGGGWVSGSIEETDTLCAELAERIRCAVASVGYRLAPAHPFPAAVDDCFGAAAWVEEHAVELGLDARRLAVGGTSAGANLATAVARLARARGAPQLVLQLLVYPPTDHAADADVPGAAFRRGDIARYWAQYLADPDEGDDPLASPLRAHDLAGLPPALVITAGLDPLADEAEEFGRRLGDAGVPVEVRRFAGAEHGFFSSATPQGLEARGAAAAALRIAFGT